MTLAKAVENFDSERENSVSLERKIEWISQLDYKISGDFSEPRGDAKFEGYSVTSNPQIELKAPNGYGEIYSVYMNMQLDYMNGEIARYNNSASRFNRLYKELGDYINRQKAVIKKVVIEAGDLIV